MRTDSPPARPPPVEEGPNRPIRSRPKKPFSGKTVVDPIRWSTFPKGRTLKLKKRSKRFAGVVAASTVAMMVTLAVPASSAVASSSSATFSKGPSQEQWKQLDKAAKKYHSLAGALGDSSKQVVSLPAGTSAAEKSKLVAAIPVGMDVTVKISRFTKEGLDKTEKTLSAKKWHADAGKYAFGFAYDAEQDKIKVDTDAPASVTQSLLDANPGKIRVHRTRFESQRSRFNDWSPFSGGASIVNQTIGPWAGCTAGVTVKNVFTGARKMMTAGHCGKEGDVFLHRYSDNSPGPYFGAVEARWDSLDMELLGGASYGGHIWTGGYQASTSFMGVSGGSNVWPGLQVCVSGAVTLNHCGHPVRETNYNYYPQSNQGTWIGGNSGFTYDQGGTAQPWGWQWGRATEPGDSGAPVYYTDQYGAFATIVGTHSARIWGECGCWKMIGVKIGPELDAARLDLVKHWE
ncbi:hypothetical protein [Streptomyces lacrimifluminis]|nr:hypothetical protein [Streptomyces lacrimifluminis]